MRHLARREGVSFCTSIFSAPFQGEQMGACEKMTAS